MNIQAIYPPTAGTIPKACTSCGGNVDMACGFVDMDGKPFKSYQCRKCTVVQIGSIKSAALLEEAQNRYRDSTK